MLNPDARWQPRPHQVPPTGDDWRVWFLKAGRGSGKTDAGAHFVDSHAMGPPCFRGPRGHRIGIIAPTLGDAREICVEGESGLQAANPRIRFIAPRSLFWPNGARGQLFGAFLPEDPERLRGPQHCLLWCEEIASWRYLEAAWNMAEFGLRLGPRPRAILTSTPKPRPKLREIATRPATVITHATTDDNPYLAASRRAELFALFGGTRLGRQELLAEDLTDVPGALWSFDETAEGKGVIRYRPAPTIERGGKVEPNLARVVVAVDPNASDSEEADEAGIVVAALGHDGLAYVLADRSAVGGPTQWAARACQAAEDFAADLIVAESNNGGEMVRLTINAYQDARRRRGEGRIVPVKLVTASRGKRTRAEPVAMLYEQGRVFHAEPFDLLEDQLTHWTPESGDSPDRLDAAVWALTELLVGPVSPSQFSMVA